MTITICASVDFTPTIVEVKEQLEEIGHTVNIPYFTQKIIDGDLDYDEFIQQKETGGDITLREGESVNILKRYWNLIKDSDAILVLNMKKKGIENYIGGNTFLEMGFAYGMGKKIFLYNPIPEKSERMHYTDEILEMEPVVINGDLSSIV